MRSVLTFGTSYMEMALAVRRLPDVGENLSDDGSVHYAPNGADATLAVAVAKLGLQSIFSTKLGADYHGQRLFDYFRGVGVDTSAMKVDRDYETGLVLKVRTPEGERRITLPGANQNMTPDNLTDVFADRPDAALLGFSLPFSTVLSAMKSAAANAVPIFLYGDGLTFDLKTDILPVAEVLILTEEETIRLSGARPAGHSEALAAALNIFKKVNVKHLVIHMSGRGLFLYDGRHFRILPPVGNVRNKNADTETANRIFTAALVASMANGMTLDDAAAYAAGAEAFVLLSEEGGTVYPTDADVRNTIRRYQ